MITTLTQSPRITNTKNLTTSYQTVVDCSETQVKIVESICISCGGTGTDVWLTYTNGANDFPIWNEVPIAANTTLFITDFHLRIGYRNDLNESQVLKAKAAAGDLATVIVITLDAPPVQANNGFVGGNGTGGGMIGWRGA
jgi:hypothetical protein